MGSAAGGSLEELLDEQVVYYRAVAAEYEQHTLPFTGGVELAEALDAFRPTGSVLELACGPGTWTAQLLRHATDVTAVDASPEMLAIASARVSEARVTVSEQRVRFVPADLFHWQPDRRYDVVFFGFWLSHVPPERFESFWSLVANCLKPDGRVLFVDDGYRTAEELIEGELSSTIQRRLTDGTAYRIVKVAHRPADLERRLERIGWRIKVWPTSGPFFWGAGSRASRSPFDLRWRSGQHVVTWTRGDDTVHKRYPLPPYSVTTWPDPPSVVVVEAQDDLHPRLDNAVVLEPDGSERVRLRPPPNRSAEPARNIGFYVVYPEAAGLVAVFSTSTGDFWGRPDLNTGELSDLTHWR